MDTASKAEALIIANCELPIANLQGVCFTNKTVVFHYVSKILLVGSLLYLLPALVCLYYGEYNTALVFVMTAAVEALMSLPLSLIKLKKSQMYSKESLAIVALLWILFPFFGAIPYYASGEISSVVDALFESISGFTTTSASVITDVEAMPHGMIFWRSFTNWIGGMGVLVLAIAVLPKNNSSLYLMQAECPGPQVGKIAAKSKNSAKILYIIYVALTVLVFVLLIIGKMPVFDSVCHAMSTAGTGGYCVKNEGIAYYNSAYIDAVLSAGMFIFGVNFSLYYFFLTRRFRDVIKNTELKSYIGIVITASLLIAARLYFVGGGTILSGLRRAVFQVTAMISSTGFSNADFTSWDLFSQVVLVVLMCIGACGGSTGGGFKVMRVTIIFKSAVRYIKKAMHPNSVSLVTADEKSMNTETVHGVHAYLIIYIFMVFISWLIITLDNTDFTTSFTAVIASINNIGVGLSEIGPGGSYGFFSVLSKITLAVDMLLGRLELIPMVILFAPSAWKKTF